MDFSYFPHTDEDIRQMLDTIGIKSLEELYSDVPDDFIFRKDFDLPDTMSEIEVRRYFENLDKQNTKLTIFAGGGAYDHYSPAVVPYIISRGEFATAYTPYQPEISQGTLRYIFEFQSMITGLTGMDCANASMYDGPTAAAEAMFMTVAATKKKTRVLISNTLLPQVRKVMRTYAKFHGLQLTEIENDGGQTSFHALKRELQAGDVAGLVLPSVNRFGIIEDLQGFADVLHEAKALLVMYSDLSALSVIKTPAEWGADIVCGEGQSLGIPMCYGGPYVGYLACKKDFLRKLPGRIVGATTDVDGKRAFVLTLQAREQHIRREKATSNICSNQSLMALYVTVYLSLMGPRGLRKVNELSYGAAHYLHDRLLETGRFTEVFDRPFLQEFALKTVFDVKHLQKKLLEAGFFGALYTEEGYVTFCATEKRTKEEIDRMVEVIKTI